MISFRIKPHSIRDTDIVEILDGGRLLGVIYPEEWGIRLVSKYLNDDGIAFDDCTPPVLEVKLP